MPAVHHPADGCAPAALKDEFPSVDLPTFATPPHHHAPPPPQTQPPRETTLRLPPTLHDESRYESRPPNATAPTRPGSRTASSTSSPQRYATTTSHRCACQQAKPSTSSRTPPTHASDREGTGVPVQEKSTSTSTSPHPATAPTAPTLQSRAVPAPTPACQSEPSHPHRSTQCAWEANPTTPTNESTTPPTVAADHCSPHGC